MKHCYVSVRNVMYDTMKQDVACMGCKSNFRKMALQCICYICTQHRHIVVFGRNDGYEVL